MEVKIIAAKNCTHWTNMVKELNDLGIDHEIVYVEDHPDLCRELSIRHSPNLVVGREVVFRRQPSEAELREYFEQREAQISG